MLDDFDFYMRKWTNAECHAVLRDALLVLDSYGETGTMTAVAQQLEDADGRSGNDIMDIIQGIILDGLQGALLQFDLRMSGTVQDLSLILRGFQTLTTSEEHEYIIAVLDVGDEPFDAINDLLEYCDVNAMLAWQQCVDVYTNVSNGLLLRLRAVHESALANESVYVDPVTTEQQTRFQRLRYFFGKYPESLAYKAIVAREVVTGLPLQTLLGMFRIPLAMLETQQPLIIASSLLGLVMISDTPTDRIMSVAKDAIDDIWFDRVTIDVIEKALDTMALDIGRSA